MTIKSKLTYLFTLIVGTLLFLFSVVIYFASADFLEKDFLNRFKEKVNLTANLLIKNGLVNENIVGEIDKQTLNTILGEKVLIFDQSKTIYYHSFEGNSHPFTKSFLEEIDKNKEAFLPGKEVVWFGKNITIGDKKLSILAESKRDYLLGLNKLKGILAGGLMFSIFLIFLTGRYFAGRSLAPISRVIKEVNTISATNLHNRVSVALEKDEIANLSQTFNQLLERLDTAFQMQRNFISHASHELRTPLSSITAQLEVTLLNTRTVEEYHLVLNSVLEDIKDMNHLSESLFDLTLASRDLTLMKFGKVRLDELLLQSRTELLKRKNEYSINIQFCELPDDEMKLTVFGKEHLIKSTFINLMDNACKFSKNKTVEVNLELEPKKISIKFTDKGIGIPESYLRNIFTPLLRGENTKGIPGHGLGLALTKKIIELHHGEIQVVSEENQGTVISLSFPSLA